MFPFATSPSKERMTVKREFPVILVVHVTGGRLSVKTKVIKSLYVIMHPVHVINFRRLGKLEILLEFHPGIGLIMTTWDKNWIPLESVFSSSCLRNGPRGLSQKFLSYCTVAETNARDRALAVLVLPLGISWQILTYRQSTGSRQVPLEGFSNLCFCSSSPLSENGIEFAQSTASKVGLQLNTLHSPHATTFETLNRKTDRTAKAAYPLTAANNLNNPFPSSNSSYFALISASC